MARVREEEQLVTYNTMKSYRRKEIRASDRLVGDRRQLEGLMSSLVTTSLRTSTLEALGRSSEEKA